MNNYKAQYDEALKVNKEQMELIDQMFEMLFGAGVAIANKMADLKKRIADTNLEEVKEPQPVTEPIPPKKEEKPVEVPQTNQKLNINSANFI